MDYQGLKRRDLQALCKRNNIPANITNAAMADALASLPTVEGLEEFLSQPVSDAPESPERSEVTSSRPRRTATRQKATKDEVEGSKLAATTRCGTRGRAVEKTDTKKTTITRTTRKKASPEASIQSKSEKDLQADFEADLESEFSEASGLTGELKEISEEVSGVSADSEVVSDVQEIANEDDSKENMEDHQEEPVQKMDFHNLGRKDLQALCKKNKIPANTTNAAMADALDSLEIVEGLEEFLKDYDSLAPLSPEVSKTTKSRVRGTMTSRRINKEASSSKLITKSCFGGTRRKVTEEINEAENKVSETPVAASNLQCQLEAVDLEKPEVLDCMSENNTVIDSTEAAVTADSIDVPEQLGDLVKEIDANVSEDVTAKSSEATEVFSDVGLETESEKGQLEKLDSVIDSTFDVSSAEKLQGSHEEEQILEKFESDSTVADNAKTECQDNLPEALVIASESDVDSPAQKFEGIHEEDKLSENFNSDSTTQCDESLTSDIQSDESLTSDIQSDESLASNDDSDESLASDTQSHDSLALDINSVSESSGSKLDELVATPVCTADLGPVEHIGVSHIDEQKYDNLEDNIECESENSERDELVSTTTESAAHLCPIEKLEAIIHAEDVMWDFDTESTIQDGQCVAKEKETPLCHKSMRKLKKLLKEKLQATTLLENQMENLTLEDGDVSLSKVEEDIHPSVEFEVESDGLASEGKLEVDSVLVPDVISGDPAKDVDTTDGEGVEHKNVALFGDHMIGNLGKQETNSDGESTLSSVSVLLDNEVVSLDSVIGRVSVESDQQMTAERQSDITPSKSSSKTLLKPLFSTPSKLSSKTPKSVGRMTRVLDINKENIDHSAPRTETGKINIAVAKSGNILSAKSMGKLKKEFKTLQQQSEKKRPALQSRSENCDLLASP